MKSPNITSYVLIAIIAIAGFFALPFLSFLTVPTAFVTGTIITGIVMLLVKSSDTQQDSTNNDELTTLYIGNLNYKVNENNIKLHFEKYGYVDSVRLMKDRKTGRRKGFGFVEVSANSADKMIKKLNDSTFEERTLRVRLAKEKVED